ncbi:MAG: Molybdate transporter, ATP-binding protein [Hyphomicrobiales bacterium]|nr:Molybdate transporter, ATP-binding protein [Hyphomicrobiales bacterium]
MIADDEIHASFRGTLGGFELDVTFVAPARGVTALFGPSGCGKTTVLRCLAGLQRAAHGTCVVGGDVWQDASGFRPPHKRPVGYVFQEASLFPHLSVRGNLLYGARSELPAGTGPTIDLDEVVSLLGLASLLDRSPEKLSGGERQRVAIGRALLAQPRILLMDEPLAALDQGARDEILPFLDQLNASLLLPVIYVSHDLAEVERLADTLVLMERGRVTASGPLVDLQGDLSLPLVAAREASVRLDGVVASHDAAYGLMRLDVPGGSLIVHAGSARPGDRRRVRIGATDVSLARERPHASSILNILPVQIVSSQPLGHDMNVLLALGDSAAGARLVARITRKSWDELGLAVGMDVFAQVKGISLLSFGSSQSA